jgi:hypothetical protein
MVRYLSGSGDTSGKSREELKGNPSGAAGIRFDTRIAWALSLALLLAMGVSAQQPEQQQQQQDPNAQSQGQSGDSEQTQAPPAATAPQYQPPAPSANGVPNGATAQTPPSPPPPAKKPKYAPQDADRPPYSNDYPAPKAGSPAHAPSPDQYDPNQDLGPGEQGVPDADAPNGAPDRAPNGSGAKGAPSNRPDDDEYGAPNGNRNGNYGKPQNAPHTRNAAPSTPPPATLTIPAGTVLSVRINEYLSSDQNQVGDRVTATLQQPVVVNGYVVARRGQMLVGQVEAAEKAGRIKGTSQLGIELTDMTVADGQSRPILTELWKASGGTTHGADAAAIGGTTALGAAIGSVADWGRGAAIGAGAGAAAGIGAVLLTRGRPTVIPPETWLTFRLKEPVTVDTTQSAQAFVPVSQYDLDNYGRRGSRYAGGNGRPGPYGPAPYACGYDAPCLPPPTYAYPYAAYPYAAYPGYYYPAPTVYFGGYYGRRWYRW